LSLWNPDWTEWVEGISPDGRKFRARIEYRPWGALSRGHDETGCPHCGWTLFDRLVHVFWEGSWESEYHLDSGENREELKAARITSYRGRDVFVRDGRVIFE